MSGESLINVAWSPDGNYIACGSKVCGYGHAKGCKTQYADIFVCISSQEDVLFVYDVRNVSKTGMKHVQRRQFQYEVSARVLCIPVTNASLWTGLCL